MKEEKKKIIKMTDEILKYFINKNGKKINILIDESSSKYLIEARSDIDLSDDELIHIYSKYDKHKDIEYDIFWELIGEVHDEDELDLLFILADDINIYYQQSTLIFSLELKKNL